MPDKIRFTGNEQQLTRIFYTIRKEQRAEGKPIPKDYPNEETERIIWSNIAGLYETGKILNAES